MTQEPLVVYGRATSSNVQALLWGLEELGLPYERLDFGEVYGGLDMPEFRALTPHGQIPVLKVGDTAIWETPAILRYLATAHGDDSFWPSDPFERARVDMWAEWAKHSIAEAFTVPVFWNAVRTCRENRDEALIARNLSAFEAELAKAERCLSQHAYLCGASLSLADVQFGHVLFRYYDAGLAQADLTLVRSYYQRLSARPAYQRSVMVSYAALRDTF
ncbi:MAG: glutathione S-transferase family protein [Pseudomonadota bacterium]